MAATVTLPVDMELKKAFQDLQKQMIDTSQSLKVTDVQIDHFKRGIQHSKLTESEISGMPDDVKMYRGVGRMFVCEDMKTIHQSLNDKIKENEEKIKKLEDSKVYLQKNLKDSENNIREMIISKNRQ